jgi:hypothetical protein
VPKDPVGTKFHQCSMVLQDHHSTKVVIKVMIKKCSAD